MKKRNMTLPKRLLAMSLSLAMCAGMVCTTAFAEGANEDKNNAYVYINVTPGTVATGDVDETPDFDSFNKGNVEKPTEADVPSDKTVTDTASEIDTIKDGIDNFDNGTETAGKPVFDESLGQAVEEAKTGVVDSLNDLVGAVPGFDGEKPKVDQVGEVADGAFVDTVKDKVEELNNAKTETESKVDTGEEATEGTKRAEAEAAKTALEAAAEKALTDLGTARDDAETKAQAAKDAAQAVADAVNAEKEGLQKTLNDRLTQLAEKDPGAAPAVTSFETYEEYTAAYDTWEADRLAYNELATTIQGEYDAAVIELEGKVKEANDKVTAAADALTAAEEALKAFEGANGKYVELNDDNGLIKAYNDALAAYEAAINGVEDAETGEKTDGYNDKVDDYTGAAEGYNDAVDAYNEAKAAHDEKVTEYNGKLDEYNTKVDEYENAVNGYIDEVTQYETKVDAYNDVVDSYNTTANDHNDKQTAEAQKELEKAAEDDEIAKALSDALDKVNSITVSKPKDTSDVEAVNIYNTAVGQYNDAVKAYNDAVAKYNETMVQRKLDQVEEYFGKGNTHQTETGAGGTTSTWCTYGKVSVSGLFKDNLFTSGSSGTFSKELVNGSYKQPDSANNTLVTWTKNSDGTFTATGSTNVGDGGNGNKDVTTFYQNGVTTANLGDKLEEKQFTEKEANRGQNKSPVEDVDRWVLVMARGANNYQGTSLGNGQTMEGKTLSLHINGYLKVQQLGTLAKLETLAVKEVTVDQAREEYGQTVTDYKESKYTEEKGSYAKEADELKDGKLDPVPEVQEYGSGTPVTTPEGKQADEWTAPDNGVVPTDAALTGRPSTIPEGTRAPEPDNEGGDPTVIIEDPEVPLADLPETPEEPEEEVIIPDEEVPLAETPDEVIIPDEEVPLAAVPQTGDISTAWYAVALTSACALTFVTLRRKEEED